MRNAVKYIYKANPIYVHLLKHFCPQCGNRTKVSYISKTVNSKSEEARDYDFSIVDTFYTGDVEFRTQCFYCELCDTNISVEEMKAFEAQKKKN